MLLVGFETTISAGERPQTYALDRKATGTDYRNVITYANYREAFHSVHSEDSWNRKGT